MISGLVTTIASMPVDIAKTRLQSMKYVDGKFFLRIFSQLYKIIQGVTEYKGAGDVLGKVIKKEGFFTLWKGFTPYYFRLGPHTVLTFIFLEQANIAYKLHVLGIEGGSGGL
jgi:solute carrier family 25 oxoglutarate transporter 11